MWRIFQINKHLSRPGHVWSKFGSGNLESLSKAAKDLRDQGQLPNGVLGKQGPNLSVPATPIDSRSGSPVPSISSATSDSDSDGGPVGRETRRRLVEWWSHEYCASRMRLAVVGKGSNPATFSSSDTNLT